MLGAEPGLCFGCSNASFLPASLLSLVDHLGGSCSNYVPKSVALTHFLPPRVRRPFRHPSTDLPSHPRAKTCARQSASHPPDTRAPADPQSLLFTSLPASLSSHQRITPIHSRRVHTECVFEGAGIQCDVASGANLSPCRFSSERKISKQAVLSRLPHGTLARRMAHGSPRWLPPAVPAHESPRSRGAHRGRRLRRPAQVRTTASTRCKALETRQALSPRPSATKEMQIMQYAPLECFYTFPPFFHTYTLTMRHRADPNAQGARGARNPQESSPYPWSTRRLNFTTTASPFPRYGAAINSAAGSAGVVYIMGGLVAGATVKGDLWVAEMGNGTMACYPISTTGDGPGPRVGHSSLLVGNAFIVFGGDTKLDENDDLDDTLYLLNTCKPRESRRVGLTLT